MARKPKAIVIPELPNAPALDFAPGDLWVFGYGSLMWRPGFPYVEAKGATLYGYHRALCLWSYHYRGTPAKPGLVFGLDAGGACRGRAFRVAARHRVRVVRYLYRRELISYVYVPKLHRVHPDGRGPVRALIFVADRDNPQYAGKLSVRRAAAIMAVAAGRTGTARDYLASTVAHLDALGIRDGAAHAVHERVMQLPASRRRRG
ncbi:MAG TPA: gamma-glutamylcyclotransferase [Candidatus Cybelea sp.]|nr:gamma-glutamylcyclotransferase [Candidatus Cybelea sp.]